MKPLLHEIAETRVSTASLPHETTEPMVSMLHLPREIQQKILIGLNITDLIRCKSVCKPWSSLISDPVFVKDHLNHQYQNDRNDKTFRHRRITMSKQADYFECRRCFCVNDHHLLGSSNGLVCVSPYPNEILVINPSTREVQKITKPQIPVADSSCLGFGYDSQNDDYKIIIGVKNGENCTCFQVFSLRSNDWKVIKEINYVFTSRVGMLCEGALHWLAYDASPEKKNAILSFHFSDETFLEVPTPDDATYNALYTGKPFLMRLGTMDGRLCLFRFTYVHNIWVMNNERSWDECGRELVIKNDAVHLIKQLKNYIPYKRPLCHRICSRDYQLVRHRMFFFGTPLFVESLVSPHFHKKVHRKRQATSAIKCPKVKANRHANPDASENASTSSGLEN